MEPGEAAEFDTPHPALVRRHQCRARRVPQPRRQAGRESPRPCGTEAPPRRGLAVSQPTSMRVDRMMKRLPGRGLDAEAAASSGDHIDREMGVLSSTRTARPTSRSRGPPSLRHRRAVRSGRGERRPPRSGSRLRGSTSARTLSQQPPDWWNISWPCLATRSPRRSTAACVMATLDFSSPSMVGADSSAAVCVDSLIRKIRACSPSS